MEGHAPAKTFRDLIVWQKAHLFTLTIYKLTANFPKNEVYGLSSQMRRAAVSIAANISEGFKMSSKPQKARFLNIAQGSLEESRYFLILTNELKLADTTVASTQIEHLSQLLERYRTAIIRSNK